MRSYIKTKRAYTRIVTRRTLTFPIGLTMLHVVTMKNRFSFYDLMHALAHFEAQIPAVHSQSHTHTHISAITYSIAELAN